VQVYTYLKRQRESQIFTYFTYVILFDFNIQLLYSFTINHKYYILILYYRQYDCKTGYTVTLQFDDDDAYYIYKNYHLIMICYDRNIQQYKLSRVLVTYKTGCWIG
jgi:hypothetical protein